jgi:hypothetical protein
MRGGEKLNPTGGLVALERRQRDDQLTKCQMTVRIFSTVWLFHANVAAAAPPVNVTPDPALHEWFTSLAQPGTQKPCCSISDCRFTEYKERNGQFEIIIEGWPYIVPNHVILRAINNPTARAVVCYGYASFGPPVPQGAIRTSPQDTIEILCFIPEKSIS